MLRARGITGFVRAPNEAVLRGIVLSRRRAGEMGPRTSCSRAVLAKPMSVNRSLKVRSTRFESAIGRRPQTPQLSRTVETARDTLIVPVRRSGNPKPEVRRCTNIRAGRGSHARRAGGAAGVNHWSAGGGAAAGIGQAPGRWSLSRAEAGIGKTDAASTWPCRGCAQRVDSGCCSCNERFGTHEASAAESRRFRAVRGDEGNYS